METEQQKPDDDAPVAAASSDAPAPSNAPDDFEKLISEFEQNTTQPEPEPASQEANAEAAPAQDLDALLRELSGPDPRVAELSSQNAQLLEQINEQRVQKAYSDLTAELQRDFPHVSREDIGDKLEAAAARNPEVAFAWRNQFADKNAANRELLMVETKLANLRRNPAADPNEVQQLTQQGYQWGLVLNASKIVAREVSQIKKRLDAEPEIDWSATFDRNMVAASVRGSGGKIPPSPPPDYGKMSAHEGRQKVKDEFGFDPGWGH